MLRPVFRRSTQSSANDQTSGSGEDGDVIASCPMPSSGAAAARAHDRVTAIVPPRLLL
jgi:hypothetical protein